MVIDLKTLYGAEATEQQKRYEELSAYFAEEFGDANALSYFSAPGRTEVGGNHTDHNNLHNHLFLYHKTYKNFHKHPELQEEYNV